MPRSDTAYSWYTGVSDYSEAVSDERRRCQVEGCSKKHAYRKPDGVRKVYSRYCSDHTCSVALSAEEGTHCPAPREAGERYCPDHLQCGEPNCRRMGEYVHKAGSREYIRWFCTKHRCSAPDCLARATDPQQQCCAVHFVRCGVPDCTRPAHRHRDGRLDAVCAAHYGTHRCLFPACDRRTTARYCPAHQCAVSDCSAGRQSTPAAAEACRRHLCHAPFCPHPVLYPTRSASSHCARHTCRATSCPARRSPDPGADHCPAHTCATPGCRAGTRPDAAAAARHCARHACVVAACPHPRLAAVPSSTLAVGADRDRCEAHARARERRSASLGADGGLGLDWEGLRGRFELSGERERERERKRMSEDLEQLRRWEREREREREESRAGARVAGRSREGDLEDLERLRRGFEEWGRLEPGWSRTGW